MPTAALRSMGGRHGRGTGLRSLLLATTAFATLAAALPASAQTVWTGTNSTSWFDGLNWTGGMPTLGVDAEIDTPLPSPQISGLGAIADHLIVGKTATGLLAIQGGGSLLTTTTHIGHDAGALGSVLLTGAGSTWTNTADFYVGYLGQGSLSVLSGAAMTSVNGYIGYSGSGSASVSGAGSAWTLGGPLSVGYFGIGSLTIGAGGSVGSVTAVLAETGGSQGTVNVTGGTWTSTGQIVIGGGGTGTMTVTAGGIVSSVGGIVGNNGAAAGDVTVSGAGSSWTNTSGLTIGAQGNGQLGIAGGGAVSSTGNSFVGDAGTGLVTVTGAGSTLTLTNRLYVGNSGTGTVRIEAGGVVTAHEVRLGELNGSSGSFEIKDAGSQWTGSGEFYVGKGGSGSASVTGGATVTSQTLVAGFDATGLGEILISGTGSSWTTTNSAGVGGDGTGHLVIEAGGALNVVSLAFASSTSGTGTGTVSGAGTTLTATSGLYVGGSGTGSLTVSGGAAVTSNEAFIASGLNASGVATVTGSGSTWANSTTFTIGSSGTGTLNVAAGAKVGTLDAVLGRSGQGQGALNVTGAGSSFLASGDMRLGEEGTGVLTVANDGIVAVDGTTSIAVVAGSTGTLVIGAAKGSPAVAPGSFATGALAFGAGNGGIIFNHSSDAYQFAAAMTGAGMLEALSGTTVLSGDSSGFTGAATVSGGTLVLNGALGGTLGVQAGARLQGSGTAGSVTVATGGTIAPGNSTGTFTVTGSLVLAPGSTYAAEIAGNGASDRIAVTGQATVAGGQVTVSALDPQTSYVDGQRYTILTAAGGVIGNFASPTTQSAFLDLSLDHRTNAVDLVIAVKGGVPAFESVALTRNQLATAGALVTLPQAGGTLALYNSLLMLDAASARGAFDLLSGEIHASAKTALAEESWLLRSAANDRLRSAFGAVGAAPMATMSYGFSADLAPSATGPMPGLRSDRFAVWGQGYGSWGRTDSDGNAARLTRSTGGFLVGADAAVFDTMRFGLIAGYSHSEFDAKARLSSGKSDNYHLGLYGGGQWGRLALRTGASYTWHDVETNRTVAFAGFGDGLRADYNAGTVQVFGELGYRVDLGRVALEPFAGLAYVNLHSDGFRESGGAAALTARGDDTNLGYSTLGLRASTSTDLQGMALTLRGALAWRHAFGDVTPLATLAFSGSSAFTVAGVPIARNAALLEAGLDLAISQTATLGLSYTSQLASDAQDHAFKGNLAVRF